MSRDESAPGAPRILVLGIGNLLWADEGFGVRAAEAMAAEWDFPENVTVMDGGTQGLYLLPHLEETDALIVFDAIDYGLTPGEMKIVRGDDVPSFMGAKKMSLHQTGFQDVIATAELMGYRPENLLLIGVQPEELEDYGGGLRAPVAAQIQPAIDIALAELRDAWGVTPTRREQRAEAPLADPSISRDAYEGGRPSEDEACRVGDDRFIRLRAEALAAEADLLSGA
ncbi:HyaD/HybD family hydrogenase maturation endopeptidase [Rhodovulum sp. DZ06]|uniref:HyaD/HybD family hydrogenase maturation endopeptidase n=1 Tax=Rhodovulum sp. DZ06 TaxID=3425126 RepID=UPI003D3361F7